MHSVSREEFKNLIIKHAGNSLIDAVDELLPGFKKFYETDPACAQILRGDTEASTVIFLYNIQRGLPIEALTEIRDLLGLSILTGYYLRELEGERVPVGAVVH